MALVIANADYQTQPKLPSCKKDGIDMKNKLEELNFDVSSFEKLILERILGFGFVFENYRWVYNGKTVKMGDFNHNLDAEVRN